MKYSLFSWQPIYVFLGAGIGGVARFLIASQFAARSSGALPSSGFPVGTFVVNVTGCLLIGVLAGLLINFSPSSDWRVFAVTGILGGFTTFSAFSLETVQLVETGQFVVALLYVFGSCATSFLATAVGFVLAKGFALRA